MLLASARLGRAKNKLDELSPIKAVEDEIAPNSSSKQIAKEIFEFVCFAISFQVASAIVVGNICLLYSQMGAANTEISFTNNDFDK